VAHSAPRDAAERAAREHGDPVVEAGEWSEAIRFHRWADAARLIDSLPQTKRDRPEVKFARARVALELSDHARAAKLLAGLEKELPQLAIEIQSDRAEAELEAGPWESAARYYAARKTSTDMVKAAIAFERANELAKARAAADRAVGLAATKNGRKKRASPSAAEVEARHVRARIAEKLGKTDVAAVDLRWLATFAPTATFANDIDERLSKLAPKRVLTRRERFERARAMADEGQIADLEREIERMGGAPGPAVSQADLLHVRGWAHYKARDYAQAAELLEKSGRAGGANAVHDLFYAARALSRANHDDRAIKLYGEVARRFKKSAYGEQAEFLAARLLYIMGRWRQAADAFARYTSRHAKDGRYLGRVSYEEAVATLAAGRHAKAAKSFHRLATAASRDHEKAHLQELEGVALALSGKKEAAIQTLRGVIDDKPLSFAALAAASRLTAMGAGLPPAIEPAGAAKTQADLAVKLPSKARLLRDLGLDGDAERVIREQEELIRRQHAPRGDEALCEMYGQLSEASRRYRVGVRAVRASALNRAPASDTRWMWDCLYPRPYEPMVRAAEKEWGLPPQLTYAVMRQESAFSPIVVSPAKAVGLMQLIPPTAESAAKEIEVPYEPLLLSSPPYNIRVGTYYLHKVLGTFGGNVALAAAAYNAGPAAVSRWLESGEGLPLDVFVARIPYDETRNYVTRVIGNMARYAFLEGGDSAVPKLGLEIPKGLRAPSDAY